MLVQIFGGDKQRALWYVIVFRCQDFELLWLVNINWTQLARRRELHTVNMVYKYTHGLAPEYLRDRFVSNYFLRDSSNKFDVPLTPHQLS